HETTVSPFGALEDFASRLINSGGDVDQVDAGFHEELGEGGGAGGREATLHIFLHGDAVTDGIVRPHDIPDSCDNLEGESGPVLCRPAILVSPLVAPGREELFQEITV